MNISFAECYKNPTSCLKQTDEPIVRNGLHNTGFYFLLRKEQLKIGEMWELLDVSVPAPYTLLTSASLTASWIQMRS